MVCGLRMRLRVSMVQDRVITYEDTLGDDIGIALTREENNVEKQTLYPQARHFRVLRLII